ncbi:MAG: hypothetical protein ACOCXG_03285 [Nanoarchaeota archaeon]
MSETKTLARRISLIVPNTSLSGENRELANNSGPQSGLERTIDLEHLPEECELRPLPTGYWQIKIKPSLVIGRGTKTEHEYPKIPILGSHIHISQQQLLLTVTEGLLYARNIGKNSLYYRESIPSKKIATFERLESGREIELDKDILIGYALTTPYKESRLPFYKIPLKEFVPLFYLVHNYFNPEHAISDIDRQLKRERILGN